MDSLSHVRVSRRKRVSTSLDFGLEAYWVFGHGRDGHNWHIVLWSNFYCQVLVNALRIHSWRTIVNDI